MKQSMKSGIARLSRCIRNLNGKECWYVASGGSAGSSFSLALGSKVLRKRRLANKSHSPVYRKFEGEYNLLVWCVWRLDGLDRALTSSDDEDQRARSILAKLRGKKVMSLKIFKPCMDLQIQFTGQLRLTVFCDHVPGRPSIESNWEVWSKDKAVHIGPGAVYEIEKRSSQKDQN